jgi:DNA excision repair protein ERCC-3
LSGAARPCYTFVHLAIPMPVRPDNAAIVQSDLSILLEVHAPRFEAARDAIAPFAELEKSPEHVHTYRVTPLSLWNAASAGLTPDAVLAALEEHARFDVPQNVRAEVREYMGRWGRLRLLPGGAGAPLRLETDDEHLDRLLTSDKRVAPLLAGRDGAAFLVPLAQRGSVKQALLRLGFPVDDRAGFTPGAALDFALRTTTRSGLPFALRDYQADAAHVFVEGAPGAAGGHGVIALPCGAGKTVVALAVAAALKTRTLVLTTGRPAAHQWIAEALDKTTLARADVGEYSGDLKEVRPFTVATYHVIAHRGRTGQQYPHFALFDAQDWGLIVYDEVHLLPAPIFRITAEIQARRRLGLTATLVREDRKEGDVFSLIGPKRYDVPWKQMEAKGWVAAASCYEIRLDLPPLRKLAYATATDGAEAFRIAAENPDKEAVVKELCQGHAGDRILVIGHFLSQLERLARLLGAPLLTGATPTVERERHFDAFREGRERVLVLSRVGNFSIDLPQANVLIQTSGLFGSRQEEAQRLGRVLRPKTGGSTFYTLVSRDTSEQQYALHRQLFLTEQGYRYYVEDWRRTDEAATGGQDALASTTGDHLDASPAPRALPPGPADGGPAPKLPEP